MKIRLVGNSMSPQGKENCREILTYTIGQVIISYSYIQIQEPFMFYRRKDGKLIDKDIPTFNRMIPYLMRGRNESMITLKESLIVTGTLKFISNRRDEEGKTT